MTGFKNIVATLYLKNGQAVKSASDMTVMGDVYNLCQLYNDSGIDKIIIFDLSTDDDEHEKNIHTIENINRNIDIKVCAGGNINRIEDVKKLLYAGCLQVIFNATKDSSLELANVASEKFGKDKILLSISNVDYIFKHQEEIEDTFHELLVLNIDIIDALENLTSTPYVVYMPQFDMDKIIDVMKRETLRGIAGEFINDPENDIMALKTKLSDGGILVDNFTPDLKWSDLKLNSDGMVPVIVQDYRNEQVLMLAYMNEQSFAATCATGRMTYFSRSRQELWCKGDTSGHYQYVKELRLDCDHDTLLAKVHQVGAACHTGARSCFFNELAKKEYNSSNPLMILNDVFETIADRKKHPKEGSYTNYLFDKGIDKILKKCGEEVTEIVIAAKNPDSEELKYEISDFLYHMMVLMAQCGLDWDDVIKELANRH